MSTNEFARILLTWIKSFLSWIGIPRDRLNELDEIMGQRNNLRDFIFKHII